MQQVAIVHGTLCEDYGSPTIADAINAILEKHPEFRLVNTEVLRCDSTRCRLLCVFEHDQGVEIGDGRQELEKNSEFGGDEQNPKPLTP